MPGHPKENATEITRQFCEELRETTFFQQEGLMLRLSGSFGLATYPEDGESVQAIIRSADAMMYDVKHSTRDNVAIMGHGHLLAAGKLAVNERRTR